MKKFLVTVLGLVVIGLVMLVLFRNIILKTAIEQGVTRLTGFETKVSSITLELPGTLHVKNLVINNPAGFKEKVFTNLPEIYVSIVLPELFRKEKLHLTEVRLNLDEVHIEKNKEGITNIQKLSSVGGAGSQPAQKPASSKPSGGQEAALPFLLDKLVLTIRNVSYEDQSGLIPGAGAAGGVLGKVASPVGKAIPGGVPDVAPNKLAVDLNVKEEVFNNITDPKALVNLIVMKIVKGTTFGNLLNVNPEELLKGALGDTLASSKQILGQGQTAIKDAAGNLKAEAQNLVPTDLNTAGTKAQDALKSALGGSKDIAGSAKSQVGGLFGKLKDSVQGSTDTASQTTSTSTTATS